MFIPHMPTQQTAHAHACLSLARSRVLSLSLSLACSRDLYLSRACHTMSAVLFLTPPNTHMHTDEQALVSL